MSHVEHYKVVVNQFIYEYLDNISADNQTVDVLRYVLINNSKKIRSIFVLIFGEIFNIQHEHLKNYCVAIEMMHSYTLTHDDLPALDNSDNRRGKPTLHKLFSDAKAILYGDGLQTLAFELFSQENNSFSSLAILRTIRKFSETLGMLNGVVYGQILDIDCTNSEEKQYSLDLILKIHKYKTAVFFGFCSSLPAILSQQDQATIDGCYDFGLKFGTLFQFLDDIEDCHEKNEILNVCKIVGFEKAKTAYNDDLQGFLSNNKFKQFNDIIKKILKLKI